MFASIFYLILHHRDTRWEMHEHQWYSLSVEDQRKPCVEYLLYVIKYGL